MSAFQWHRGTQFKNEKKAKVYIWCVITCLPVGVPPSVIFHEYPVFHQHTGIVKKEKYKTFPYSHPLPLYI